VACTKHSKDKFNIVHFLYNYITSTILNTNLLHYVYLFLQHLSASVFFYLQGACCSFDVCNLYVNVFGKFADMIKIITEIFRSLKSY
jgi:hypothetical protein